MKKIVFATNNAHKLQELRQMLGDTYEILGLADIGCHEDIPETGHFIEENAQMKARFVKEHYGYDCFSDDTGLEIDALNGEPGVHSARYAGPGHDSEANIDKVLKKLDGIDNRTVILTERHGTGGFGYDSIFQPLEGDGSTFAQMSPQDKNRISHRGRAVARLVEFLNSQATL